LEQNLIIQNAKVVSITVVIDSAPLEDRAVVCNSDVCQSHEGVVTKGVDRSTPGSCTIGTEGAVSNLHIVSGADTSKGAAVCGTLVTDK
jgi:hypothetical protein